MAKSNFAVVAKGFFVRKNELPKSHEPVKPGE